MCSAAEQTALGLFSTKLAEQAETSMIWPNATVYPGQVHVTCFPSKQLASHNSKGMHAAATQFSTATHPLGAAENEDRVPILDSLAAELSQQAAVLTCTFTRNCIELPHQLLLLIQQLIAYLHAQAPS